jgi:acyl-CoA synthetase (NDP forming)
LPAGGRVAIVGNSGGPEILAADTAADNGLTVVDFDEGTRAVLQSAGASGRNPVDLGAASDPDAVATALRAVHASPEVDAVLTVFTDIAVVDSAAIRSAVVAAARTSNKPTVAVEVGAAPETIAIDESPWSIPVFTFPEPAVAALGAAHRYLQARRRTGQPPQRPAGLLAASARELVTGALTAGHEWLPPDRVDALLASYGIPRCAQRVVGTTTEAVSAAEDIGYPLAVKLAGAGLHKTDVGGVRLDIADAAQLRAAAAQLLALDCDTSAGLLVQPMAAPGVELIAGGLHDPQFGPLLMLGAGGVLTDVLQDRTFRLAPISATDAEAMISELHAARLLDGYRGTVPVDRGAVRDVLVRLATLLDDLPEIAELDINPLICRGDVVLAVDARVRVAPPPYHPDPLVRQLRAAPHPDG